MCGTTEVVANFSRDTDWFSFTLTGGTEVTWTATAEFPMLIGFIASPCPQGAFIPGGFTTAPSCTSASVTLCLPAGTYYAFVASSTFATTVNCGGPGSRYFAQLSGVPCTPYVPPNDDCGTAIAMSVGVPEFGDNTNANNTTTLDGGSGCTFSGAPANNDVWYTFTPAASGTFQVNTCGSALDTVLSVWTACPGSQFIDMIACNDDSCGLQSSVTVPLNGNQTYYVRVAGWNNAQGTFTVVVNDLGNLPPGDLCTTAHVVNEGTHSYDTTIMTVGGGPTSGCAGNGSNAEWFEYQATQTGLATVTTCGLAFWDTALAAFSSCAGGQLACNDDACGLQSTIQFGVTSGTSYWIRISGFGSSTGSGSLDISVAPPRNDDECNGAGVPALSENTFYFGDTFGATTSVTGLADAMCGTFTGSAGGSDIWATFTPASTSQFEISLCGSAYDTVLAVFSGCPADAFSNLEGCNDDFCGLQSQLTLVLNGGTTYYIRIAGYAAAQGNWQLVINNIGAPAGRCCTGNTCTVVDEVTCLNGGGVWGGAGTDCQGAAPAYTASSQPNLFINSFHQDTITIVGGQTITDLDVGIMMPHAWQGDVIVTLTSPQGTTVTLINEAGNPPLTSGLTPRTSVIRDPARRSSSMTRLPTTRPTTPRMSLRASTTSPAAGCRTSARSRPSTARTRPAPGPSPSPIPSRASMTAPSSSGACGSTRRSARPAAAPAPPTGTATTSSKSTTSSRSSPPGSPTSRPPSTSAAPRASRRSSPSSPRGSLTASAPADRRFF